MLKNGVQSGSQIKTQFKLADLKFISSKFVKHFPSEFIPFKNWLIMLATWRWCRLGDILSLWLNAFDAFRRKLMRRLIRWKIIFSCHFLVILTMIYYRHQWMSLHRRPLNFNIHARRAYCRRHFHWFQGEISIAALNGIIFLLENCIPWDFPPEIALWYIRCANLSPDV